MCTTDPGCQGYPLNYYIPQNTWCPTTVKPHVGFSSPGPATVKLPTLTGFIDHGINKDRAPQYTFGNYHKGDIKGLGPGPAYYNTRNMLRTGIERIKFAHCLPRRPELKGFQSPGPAAYRSEDCDQFKYPSDPLYTFGLKSVKNDGTLGPGPAAYCIPPTIGPPKIVQGWIKSPETFKIGIKLKNLEGFQSPGPCAYMVPHADVYKNKSPHYSLRDRYKDSKRMITPGPGAHCPEKHWFTKNSTPRYTFGIKHDPSKGTYISGIEHKICCRPC